MNWTPSTTSSTGFEASAPPWDLEVDESDHHHDSWEWKVLRSGHLIGTNHASTADLAKASAERFTKSTRTSHGKRLWRTSTISRRRLGGRGTRRTDDKPGPGGLSYRRVRRPYC